MSSSMGDGAEGEIVRRPAVGPRPVRVAALQGHAVAEFAQQSGNVGGVQMGHIIATVLVLSGTANRLGGVGFPMGKCSKELFLLTARWARSYSTGFQGYGAHREPAQTRFSKDA
jgi:hypothetical protein